MEKIVAVVPSLRTSLEQKIANIVVKDIIICYVKLMLVSYTQIQLEDVFWD